MWPFSILAQRRKQREQAILAALRRAGELSSHDLREATGISAGTFFRTLWRLEEAGHVTSRWGPPAVPGGRHRRRIYRLPVDPSS